MVVALVEVVGQSAVQKDRVANIRVSGETPEQLGYLLFLQRL